MPATPVYKLPFPDMAYSANVPRDVEALAAAVEALLATKLPATSGVVRSVSAPTSTLYTIPGSSGAYTATPDGLARLSVTVACPSSKLLGITIGTAARADIAGTTVYLSTEVKKGSTVISSASSDRSCMLDGTSSLRVSIMRSFVVDLNGVAGIAPADQLTVSLMFANSSATAANKSSALRPFLSCSTRL